MSIVSVDQATPSLAARAVWTWDLAVGEPNVAHRCTALSTRTGRWYTRACNTALPVVCARLPGEIISAPRRSTHEHVFSMNHGANLDNEFVLVKAATPFGDAAQACPGGYEFALPVQSQDNARMWRAVHGAVSPTEFVWINHMLAEDDV